MAYSYGRHRLGQSKSDERAVQQSLYSAIPTGRNSRPSRSINRVGAKLLILLAKVGMEFNNDNHTQKKRKP